MKKNKIAIIGAGNVGATTAHILMTKRIGDVVLVDAVQGVAEGKALDILESAPIGGFECQISGSDDFEIIRNSDIVVITAGSPRKPGMSRNDLLKINSNVLSNVTKEIVDKAPDAFIIVVTNPVDVMTFIAYKVSGFSKNRVMGMAGALDSTRLRSFIAMELGVSVKDISGMVLGGHGDSMLPLIRYSTVSGIPVEKLLPKGIIDSIVERTRNAGGEIVNLLKAGSAYYAPGSAIAEMIESIIYDQKRVIPTITYLEGEYNLSGICVGVPTILGCKGVEKILEVDLTTDESESLIGSVDEIRSMLKMVI